MKVIILAGGFGTRLSEYTEVIPKPMVTVGGRPILWHIMNGYAHYGYKKFLLALGYKSEIIKDYFLSYQLMSSDFSVNMGTGKVEFLNSVTTDWTITLVDTGLDTQTGGRIKRLKSYIGNEPFLLTYGDGLGDIDIKKLVSFHKEHKKLVTITAVHPGARFGQLHLQGSEVLTFKEKPQTTEGWVNGGFMVIEPEFIDFIDDDATYLEREPLEKAAAMGELVAYQHRGFWHCMDTKRDKESLEEYWRSGNPPWVT